MSLVVRNLAGEVIYTHEIHEHCSLTVGEIRQRISGICGAYYDSIMLLTEAGSEIVAVCDDKTLDLLHIAAID